MKLKRGNRRGKTYKANSKNKANVNVFLPGAVEPINRVRFANNSFNNPIVFARKLNNNNYKNDPAPIRIFNEVNNRNSSNNNNNGYTNNSYGQGMYYRPGAYPLRVANNFPNY